MGQHSGRTDKDKKTEDVTFSKADFLKALKKVSRRKGQPGNGRGKPKK
jgi:hypothetical protein